MTQKQRYHIEDQSLIIEIGVEYTRQTRELLRQMAVVGCGCGCGCKYYDCVCPLVDSRDGLCNLKRNEMKRKEKTSVLLYKTFFFFRDYIILNF